MAFCLTNFNDKVGLKLFYTGNMAYDLSPGITKYTSFLLLIFESTFGYKLCKGRISQ